jgi:hypothetical protein
MLLDIVERSRTFTTSQIAQFLKDRISFSGLDIDSLKLDPTRHLIQVNQPAPTLIHIEAFIRFKTKVGNGDGVLRLVPYQDGSGIQWKCWTFFTVSRREI